jgi:hypothetical protein
MVECGIVGLQNPIMEIQRILCPNIKVKPSPPIKSLSRDDSRERSGLIVLATKRSVLVFALTGTELSAT